MIFKKYSKVLLFVFLCLFMNAISMTTFAENYNVLSNDWYDDADIYLSREEVSKIIILQKDEEISDYDYHFEIDDKGLNGYITNGNEVVITYPSENILRADSDSSKLFSFYNEIDVTKNYDEEDKDVYEVTKYDDEGNYLGQFKCKIQSKLESIENLDLLDTSNVRYMGKSDFVNTGIFYNLTNLEDIDLSNFNTSNVIDMSNMFYGCKSLTNIDLSTFDTRKTTNMKNMFGNCRNLLNVDLTNFNTSKVLNTSFMFYCCEKLEKIDLSYFDTNEVETMEGMFQNCVNIKNIDLKNFNTENVNNMKSMFSGLKKLEDLNISSFNTAKVLDMSNMFYDCKKIKKIDLSNFIMDKVYNIDYMFYGCKNLEELSIKNKNWSMITKMEYPFGNCDKLNSIDFSNVILPIEIKKLFADLTSNSFKMLNINTKNVKNMLGLFVNSLCENIDLSNIDTSNVENMSFMFLNCKNIKEINLNSFNTTKVSNMYSMFRYCEKLNKLNIEKLNTQNVTDVSLMFSNCYELVNIDLSKFETKNVKNMNSMFYGSNKLKNLILTNFDTKKVEDMTGMFNQCNSLEYVDISSFSIDKINIAEHKLFDFTENTSLIKIKYNLIISRIINDLGLKGTWKDSSTSNIYNLNDASIKLPEIVTEIARINYVKASFNTKGGKYIADKICENGEELYFANNIFNTEKEGYIFENWYLDAEYKNVVPAKYKITSNTKFYAKWVEVIYTITFNTNGGSQVLDQKTIYDSVVVKPADPFKQYATFDGWYIDSELTTEYDFDEKVKNDIVLYAKWKY